MPSALNTKRVVKIWHTGPLQRYLTCQRKLLCCKMNISALCIMFQWRSFTPAHFFNIFISPQTQSSNKNTSIFFSIWFQTFTYSYRFTSKSHWAKVLKNVSVNNIKKEKKEKSARKTKKKKRPHLFSIVKVNLMAKSYWISAELILLLLYFLTNRLDSATSVKYSHHCGEEALYPWQIYRDFCWRFLWVLMCWNIFMTQSQQK